jgi:hypothetical protein
MARAEGSQYFEVACAGWSDGTCGGSDLTDPQAEWGCYPISISGADGTAMGTGEQNTNEIVTGCTTAGIAAKLAYDLVLGGQSDWFLPSQDELNQIYIQHTAIGGFSYIYVSSSEYSDYLAWFQYFDYGVDSGAQGGVHKGVVGYVRPVRAF